MMSVTIRSELDRHSRANASSSNSNATTEELQDEELQNDVSTWPLLQLQESFEIRESPFSITDATPAVC